MGRLSEKYDLSIKCFYNDESSKPIMVLMVSPYMKKNYLMYGQNQSMNYDPLPYVSELKKNEQYGQFWLEYLLSGLDNNNRIVLFGLVSILYNGEEYYKKARVHEELLTRFFLEIEGDFPKSVFTST